MTVSAAVPADHPLRVAWDAYTLTEEYANTLRWAVHPEHAVGSLWAAFAEGFGRAFPADHGAGVAAAKRSGEACADGLAQDDPPSSPSPNPVGDEVEVVECLGFPFEVRWRGFTLWETDSRKLALEYASKFEAALSTPPVGGGSAVAQSAGEEPSGSFASDSSCQSEGGV